MAKILLIEDDTDIREMYALILTTRSNHDVEQASDGNNGLSKAMEGGFDLILLDLMMPNLDGLGFLKKYKDTKPKQPNGSIVVMSNLAYSNAKEEALELGAADFFVKADLTPGDITDLVDKALG